MEPLLRLLAIGIRTKSEDLESVALDVGRAFACTFVPIPFEPEAETGRPMVRATMGLYRVLLEQVRPDEVEVHGYCPIGYRPIGDGIEGIGYFLGLLNDVTSRHWFLLGRARGLAEAGLSESMFTGPFPEPPSPQAAFFDIRLPATSLEQAAVLVERGLGVAVSRAAPAWRARILGIDATFHEDPDGVVLSGASKPYGDPPLDLSAVVHSLLEHGLAHIG